MEEIHTWQSVRAVKSGVVVRQRGIGAMENERAMISVGQSCCTPTGEDRRRGKK